ncbi:MAG: TOPRIM nucleotidyl transferase/hydrolase domain-containing protein [Actinomycetota bacterium]
MLDTDRRAEVEVVVGDLGAELEQDFLDHLEAWDIDRASLAGSRRPTDAGTDETAWVVRLCYRIEWDADQEQAVHWVDFPDESDPASGTYARVSRRLLDLLPVVVVGGRRRPLRLGPRSDFRRILDGVDGGSLAGAFDDLVDSVAEAGEALAKTTDIKTSVSKVLEPVEGPLGIDAADDTLVQFAPEGGSLSDVLRTLHPAIDLGPPGHLPLARHGATASALVQAGEAIAALHSTGVVVIVDDFGEDLDSISARHLAAVFRQDAEQSWISTRRSAAIEAFSPDEVLRLHFRDDSRQIAQLEPLTTKADRVAARHLSLQLLPAASAAVVVIVEGPHDRAALDALAVRRLRRSKKALPAAYGIVVIDAGVADGSGGASAVARLASLARRLGFHTIALIDGDKGVDGKTALAAAEAAADRVVRLPDGFAIERALVDGVADDVVISTVRVVCETFDVAVPPNLDTLTGKDLLKTVVAVLKKNGGLHAQFVDLLPPKNVPPMLRRTLEAIVDSGANRLTGVLQL